MKRNCQIKNLIVFILFFNISSASPLDSYNLTQAYKSYKAKDYNTTESYLKKIEEPSLQSKIALANTYYKQGRYKRAIDSYKSIKSSSIKIKQQLYFNLANSYVKLSKYRQAKIYYAKVLQLGRDDDAEHNLRLIVFLSDKRDEKLGIAHPKSQNLSSSKSEKKEEKEKRRDEDEPSSGGSGDGKSSKEREQEKKNRLISDNKEQKQPLSSKVYELINEGYIYEKQPW